MERPEDMPLEEYLELERKNLEASKKRAEAFPSDDKGIEEYLNSIPLMSSVAPAPGSNQAFDALTAFADETPKVERATNYKNSGNAGVQLARAAKKKEVKMRKYRDAVIYYTQALQLECEDHSLNSVICSNRAMANLALEQYGRARDDCIQAISFDRTNIKAYYRAAQANKALENYKQALIFVSHGLTHCNENTQAQQEALTAIKGELEKLQKDEEDVIMAKEKLDAIKLEEKESEVNKVEMSLMEREIEKGPAMFDLSSFEGYKAEPYLDDKNNLHWPVLLLYEDELQSDFIRDFHEHTTFVSQLKLMFPPKVPHAPWDVNKKYRLNRIKLSYDYCGGRSDVNLKDSLARIINNRDPPLKIPQIPTFYVSLK